MFVEQRTRPVLATVCRLLDRSPDGAVLLRHHTNAVYAVGDVVVKIAPPTIKPDRLRRVVDLVSWLVAQDFPTVRLVAGLQQPLEVDGHAVTVWERLDAAIAHPITTGELGDLLHRLHTLSTPPIDLPDLDPVAGIRHSIDASTILSGDDRDLLTERLEVLAKAWASMTWASGVGLIQSDPQVRNALRRRDDTPVLADWDGACIGPRAWDVATVAVHCRRFGADAEFASFVTTYGWDPRDSDDFEDLCLLRELQMIATNARKSAPGSPAAAEVHRRIGGMRQGREESTAWSIL
jgi:hypothetical protein